MGLVASLDTTLSGKCERGIDVPESSDADLVARAQGGDVSAIGELYDRHHTRIFRYVWSLVRDQHLAEDLTGEVFVRMVRGLANYRTRGVPFQSWLYRIAHNLTVDHQRKASRQNTVPLYHAEELSAVEGGEDDPSAVVEQRLTVERVRRALERIDPLQSEVVVMRFLVGLSLRDVAQALGKTVAAIKSLQRRGLLALRTTLASE
jgi:RNA polymerase sigma-70 factor (ECF subfamily)